jgi:outer membrane protein OmpU
MKNILMATTALVATAGIASADINNFALTGWAEMGMIGGNGSESQFHQDIDVTFAMSGETDGGLSFSASVDLDENTAFDTNTHGGSSINVSGGFGSVTLGDTDGAMDWALADGNVGSGGSIADSETGHAGYIGSYLDGNEDGQILRYDNTVGALGIAASIEMDESGSRAIAAGAGALRNARDSAGAAIAATYDTSGGTGGGFTDSGDATVALGLRYGMDMSGGSLNIGLAYQSAADRVAYLSATNNDGGASTTFAGDTITVVSADTTATGFSIGYSANGLSIGGTLTSYSDYIGINAANTVGTADTTGSLSDATHTAFGVGYTTGAVTMAFNYGELDYDSTTVTDVDGYGIDATYDLGGGAKVKLGMNDNTTGADYSVGLALSF